jgi:hypothetical protein
VPDAEYILCCCGVVGDVDSEPVAVAIHHDRNVANIDKGVYSWFAWCPWLLLVLIPQVNPDWPV